MCDLELLYIVGKYLTKFCIFKQKSLLDPLWLNKEVPVS